VPLDGRDGRAGQHADAVPLQFGSDEVAELGVDRWQHGRQLLDDGDVKATGA
jgi:hypothetical protein